MKCDGSKLSIIEDMKYSKYQMTQKQTPTSVATAVSTNGGNTKRPRSTNGKEVLSLLNTTALIEQCTAANSKRSEGGHIEKEKLFEETFQLKIIIDHLRKDLTNVIKNNIRKENQLTEKDLEIKSIIGNSDTISFELLNQQKHQFKQSNTLIHKIKHQYKRLKNDYNNEVKDYDIIKQNTKWTKLNELNIENDILKSYIDQINNLYVSNLLTNEENTAQLERYSQIEANISNQQIILKKLEEEYDNSIATEQKLLVAIEEMKSAMNEYANKLTKCAQANESLCKLNESLAIDRKRPYSSIQYNQSKEKEKYIKRITELETQLKYYKNNNKRSSGLIHQLQSTINQTSNMNHNSLNQCNIIQSNDDSCKEEQLNQLKATLAQSKANEEELEKELVMYQSYIQNMISSNHLLTNDKINLSLRKDNPFYTQNEDYNNPIQTNKMSSSQYNQFTYILYKTFEAKGIDRHLAEEKIIKPTFETHNEIDTLEIIVERMTEAILALIQNSNSEDKQRLELYLSALFYNHNGDVSKVVESFLHLFSYIQNYPPEKEERLKQRIATKYYSKFKSIRSEIGNGYNDYISLLDIKRLFENEQNEMKDKYIEYLLYKMKQFEDQNASLFDFKIKRLDELISHCNEGSFMNKSIQEISEEEYENYIKESLLIIHNAIEKRNRTFKEVFRDCIIVSHLQSDQHQVIGIDEFNTRLKEINGQLSTVQLSCLCSKYCFNSEELVLNADEIEKDLKKIQSNNSHYYEIEEEYEDEEESHKEDGVDFNLTNDKMISNIITF